MKAYDKYVQFKPWFAVVAYVSVDRPQLMAFVAEGMAFEGHPRLLLCSTRQYRGISAGPEYDIFNQDDIRNIVQMNRLFMVAQKRRPNADNKSY